MHWHYDPNFHRIPYQQKIEMALSSMFDFHTKNKFVLIKLINTKILNKLSIYSV